MSNLYRITNSKAFTVLLFITAVLLKIGIRRIFFGFGSDKLGQIVITRNFLSGHGISIDTVSTNDLSQTIYQFSPDWPIGFNMLLSPFWLLCDGDYVTATFLVDCLSVIVFTWYLTQVMVLIGFPLWLNHSFLIFQALFISEPLMSSSSDFVSTTLLLAAIFHLSKFITSPRLNKLQLYWGSILLTSAGLVRYQHIPVVLFLLCFILFLAFSIDKRTVFQNVLRVSIAIGLFFSLFFLYQYSQTVNTFFLSKMKSGFFPGNLAYLYPLVPGSFLNLELIAVQGSKIFHASYPFWMQLATWINYPLTALLGIVMIRYILRKRGTMKTPEEGFLFLGGLCSLLIIAELIFLSLTKDKHIGPPLFNWTFVSTGRYFAWIILFIQIAITWWVFCEKGKGMVKSTTLVILMFAASIQLTHGLYYLAKNVGGGLVPMDKVLVKNPAVGTVIQFIDQMKKNNPSTKVIVTAFDKQYGFVANLFGGTGFFTPQLLNEMLPRSSADAVLLVVVAEQELTYLSKFFQNPRVKLYHRSKEFFFFTYVVAPHANPRR